MPKVSIKTIETELPEVADKLEHGKSVVHSILFDKNKFDAERAREWLKTHGYKYGKMKRTESMLRYLQVPEVVGANYRTLKMKNGIELVIEYL